MSVDRTQANTSHPKQVVETFDPIQALDTIDPKQIADSQTTTLESPARILQGQRVSVGGSGSKVGFVSLGCPKALVDSERILTKLRLEGYEVVPSYEDADVVVVNTCGFIDSAKQESMDAISEAMRENGKVIVTG